MKYQLPIDGTTLYLEFDVGKRKLFVLDQSNPLAGFYLRENGLAVLQFWLNLLDLNEARAHPETIKALRRMGLGNVPDGICQKHKKPLDDCGCFGKMLKPHPPGETIRADCGHVVT